MIVLSQLIHPFISNNGFFYPLLEYFCNSIIYRLATTADPGPADTGGICFVVNCDWSTRTLSLSNSKQTSVRRSHSKILSSLPPSQGILAVVLIEELSVAKTIAKNGENATFRCRCCNVSILLSTCKSLLSRGVSGRW